MKAFPGVCFNANTFERRLRVLDSSHNSDVTFSCCSFESINKWHLLVVVLIARLNHKAQCLGAECERHNDFLSVSCLRDANTKIVLLDFIHGIARVRHEFLDDGVVGECVQEQCCLSTQDRVGRFWIYLWYLHRNEYVYEGFNLVLRSEQYNVILSS